MESLRVLHLIDSLRHGGAELLLLGVTRGLLRRGFDVNVGYSTPGPLEADFRDLGMPLYPLPRAARVDPLLFLRMARLVRHLRPDVVHTHLFKSNFHGRGAAYLAGAPVVVSTLHSADPWAANPLAGRIYGLTARFADRLIAVSEPVRAYHLAHTGVPAEKVITIENGVDLDQFNSIKASGEQLRADLKIPAGAPLLGVIGRLVADKGQVHFLRAAAYIRERQPTARFLLVGDGPQKGALHAIARDLDLEEAVLFTGFRQDIPAVMAALDVLVIPSLREGLPLTLLEAMAAGTPVVATDAGGVADVLAGEAGLVVPPGDSAALADACLKLLATPDLRARMGAAGRAIVVQRYSLERTVERLATLYRQLLRDKQRNAVGLHG